MELLWEPPSSLADISRSQGVVPAPLPLKVVAALFGAVALVSIRALFRIGRTDHSSAAPSASRSGSGALPTLGAAAASSSPASKGLQMRRIVVLCLLVANAARCASLLAELGFQGDDADLAVLHMTPEQQGWLCDVVTLVPALIFLTAFSVVVLFWAQLHYTTTIVPLPLLDCLFVCANAACYVLVVAIAVCTLLLRSYGRFRTYMTCILGILNIAVAGAFVYYGYMVIAELSETARKKLPGQRLASRVLALSVVVPFALVARGACFLAWGLELGQPTWQFVILLDIVAEWLPSVLALLILNPLKRHVGLRSPLGSSVGDSTDSEAPLLQDDAANQPRSLAGAPGLTWKQLYPPPEGSSNLPSPSGMR